MALPAFVLLSLCQLLRHLWQLLLAHIVQLWNCNCRLLVWELTLRPWLAKSLQMQGCLKNRYLEKNEYIWLEAMNSFDSCGRNGSVWSTFRGSRVLPTRYASLGIFDSTKLRF